jgi:cell division initiation protein
MTLTPVEIRHIKPAKSFLGGYDRNAIDGLLGEIAASFEDVWRERADLADKVEQLEADLTRFRELEGLLRTTLVSAEHAAVGLKEQACKEADLIVEEAQLEARTITRSARSEHERLLGEIRRMRALLQAVLALVDEDLAPEVPAAEAA